MLQISKNYVQKLQKTEKREKTKRIFRFAFPLEQINSLLFTEATQSHPDQSMDSVLANCDCQLEWTEKRALMRHAFGCICEDASIKVWVRKTQPKCRWQELESEHKGKSLWCTGILLFLLLDQHPEPNCSHHHPSPAVADCVPLNHQLQ